MSPPPMHKGTDPRTPGASDQRQAMLPSRREVIRAGTALLVTATCGTWAAAPDAAAQSQPTTPFGPHAVKEIETVWVTMPDGIRLAVRIFLPEDAESHPVPAIMQYIPYRRRDGTRIRDERMFRFLASHGYACIRPDIRGSGDSEGVLKDEYLQSEQDDGVALIAWIARQPWCSGRVGMVGISWGGFSALQVAACRPPELRAIITHCSTDDRYTDDAHYLGGCLVQDMFGWGSDFYTLQAYPPDPAVVGERWREMWKARCEAIDFSVANWVTHQTRDAFWKHASVNEDYAAIRCPVYAIGGWADAYTNSIPRLMEHLCVPRKALIGPWGHSYPQSGEPGPAIDYLHEALRWWDHWLKDSDTGILKEPMYRVWLQEDVAHSGSQNVPGRWVAEDTWPSPRIAPGLWHLNAGTLDRHSRSAAPLVLAPAHQSVGTAAGHWCPAGDGGQGEMPIQLPLEQQQDDARSLVFDSEPLRERIEVLGSPSLEVELACDKPVALLAVRLNEVLPGGTSRKMTYGVLNLTHRDGHEHPQPLEPGKRYRVRIGLKHCGFAFKPGHRIRVALSTAYWPLVWPSPEPVTLTVYPGKSTLMLPVRPPRAEDQRLRAFGEPFALSDSGLTVIRPAVPPSKTFEWDVASSELTITSRYEGGAVRFDAIGTTVSTRWEETSRIADADPTTARLRYQQTHEFSRDAWRVGITTVIDVTCTAQEYILKGEVNTLDGNTPFFSHSWLRRIPRVLS